MKRFDAKRISSLSLLCALALLAYLLEGLFPPLFIPGAKLGISNIFTLLALVLFGGREALLTVLVKCLLGTVFGNVIQASRGMISIALGVLLFRFGLGKFDAKIGPGMWLRRAVASVLMALGIILYSLAQWRA